MIIKVKIQLKKFNDHLKELISRIQNPIHKISDVDCHSCDHFKLSVLKILFRLLDKIIKL